MKILLLSHPEVDYGAYFLYNGLRQLGMEVVDYPFKLIYHGQTAEYPIPWYGTKEMGHSGPPEFFRSWSGEKYSEDDIAKMMNGFDLVVLESPRFIAVETLERLEKRRGLPPIAFVDGEDYGYVHNEIMRKYGIDMCFKRECEYNAPDIVPFPFSNYVIGDERFEFNREKTLDLFFVAGRTHPFRLKVVQLLNKIAKKHHLKAIVALDKLPEPSKKGMTFPWKGKRYGLLKYLELIASSKIGVSVRGFARDTVRFWEIPSYDTLMLSDNLYKQGLIHPYPFTDGENIAFFKFDLSDLEEKVLYYLEDESERRKVIEAQRKWVMKHHTNLARAKQLMEKMDL